MTTIIYIFFISLLTSFFLTPLVRKVALRFNIVDHPSERKIHTQPIARIGGVALFLSFVLSFVLLSFNQSMFEGSVLSDKRFLTFAAGALGIFALGLWDDLRSIPAFVKLLVQIALSIFVYYGGLQIHVVSVPFAESMDLGFLSLPATVFWFVLVINAINLIDGLDGLAAGVCLFVSMTMLVICVNDQRLLVAISFAALGGSLMGFLRYNFNPASIFMGDSGSYFLGYSIAALSILGLIKGQVATAMLIPVIALGIPLIDALWAPVRRFALGRKMFQPDTGHLHHNLVQLGYSQRRVVIIIYGCTIVLGGIAIVLVHSKDEIAALVLLVLGAVCVFLVHFMNTREGAGGFGVSRWLYEVSDATGLSHDRRSFFHHQLIISRAISIEELWAATCDGLRALEIDEADLVLYEDPGSRATPVHETKNAAYDQENTAVKVHFDWQQDDLEHPASIRSESMLILELPLLNNENEHVRHFGKLVITKNVEHQKVRQFMLSRIEHLRRSMITALVKIAENSQQNNTPS